MSNFRRLLAINVILLVLLVGGGFAGWYFMNQSEKYLKTDNAKIDGQSITIAAVASGQLIDWNGEIGKSYKAGERIGSIQAAGAPSAAIQAPAAGTPANGAAAAAKAASAQVDVTLPADATIVQQNAVKNSFVGAGTPLAHAFDLEHLWVTANIKETDINDIKLGQEVDVYVDAYTGTQLKGKVQKIGLATANTFSLLPSSNTSGNYTKVTQVIPVTIELEGYKGLSLMPGMNVTVRIHK